MANSNFSYRFRALTNYYILKTIPFLNDIRKKDKAYFLTDIGYAYKYSEPEKAKEYFSKALELKEYTHT